jgi:ATP-dependent RNA helicase RhlE
MGQGYVRFDRLEVFILDEADRMLDMGFIHDVRRVIAALPSRRQTLFFSATMPDEIVDLADSILTDPVQVAVTPSATTVEKVSQRVYFVDKAEKRGLLEWLLTDRSISRALVFTRTKHGANKVVEQLAKARPPVRAEAIHGNKSQGARERALSNFKSGATRVLVATDIAARGIDVEAISHVINYDLPNIPESYVHRIGRTARAGAEGAAISFCDHEEREFLVDIERLIRQHVPRVVDHPFAAREAPPPETSLHRSDRRYEAVPGGTKRAPRPAPSTGPLTVHPAERLRGDRVRDERRDDRSRGEHPRRPEAVAAAAEPGPSEPPRRHIHHPPRQPAPGAPAAPRRRRRRR